MLVNLIHLSDLHFNRDDGTIADTGAISIAAAATSGITNIDVQLILISGDIANTGIATDYEVAHKFLNNLKEELIKRSPAKVFIATAPGNHDCYLPLDKAVLRDALIRGMLPSFLSHPDHAIAHELLTAQEDYWRFDSAVSTSPAQDDLSKLIRTIILPDLEIAIKIILYNTALLSKRNEMQGSIFIPITLANDITAQSKHCDIIIAVLHHSQWWFESDNWIAVRQHLSQTANIVLTGHQHAQHTSDTSIIGGAKLVYGEGGELHRPNTSDLNIFTTYLINTNNSQYRMTKLKWKLTHFTTSPYDWRGLSLGPAEIPELKFCHDFISELKDIGTGYTHPREQQLYAEKLFVWPPIAAYSFGNTSSTRYLTGNNARDYLLGSKKLLIHGPALAGRSTLAKTITRSLHEHQEIPLLLNGADIDARDSSLPGHALFRKRVTAQFGHDSQDVYWQLPKDRRALIIDDWQTAGLNDEGRRRFLNSAKELYGRIILLTDAIVPIPNIVNNSGMDETLAGFDCAWIRELNSRSRLDIIEKWLVLGREMSISKAHLVIEIDRAERYVNAAIGKSRLPSLPFVILTILQQFDRQEQINPEAGSFGYLYEVLVTSALNKSESNRPQIENKYQVLTLLSEKMFKTGSRWIEASEFRALVDSYVREYAVSLNNFALVNDLCSARVLAQHDGGFSFYYEHFYFYFVARYFKTALNKTPAARDQLNYICDNLDNDINAEILMFTIYLTHDGSLIDRLIKNADAMLNETPAAELEQDVSWLNLISAHFQASSIPINEEDTIANRRAYRDYTDQLKYERTEPPAEPPNQIRLAFRHVELLGQVMRNFPGTLNANQKHALIKSSVSLSLRALTKILSTLNDLESSARLNIQGDSEMFTFVQKLIRLLARICTQGCIRHLSISIGVAESEPAYSDALEAIGDSSAIELTMATIKMDHFGEFPVPLISALANAVEKNPFVFTVLGDIVASHIAIFETPSTIRSKMAKLFCRRLPSHELAASPQARF